MRKSRGIGFVIFEKDEDAHAAAQKLDGKEIAGRTLQIKVQGRAARMEGPARDAAASPAGSSAGESAAAAAAAQAGKAPRISAFDEEGSIQGSRARPASPEPGDLDVGQRRQRPSPNEHVIR